MPLYSWGIDGEVTTYRERSISMFLLIQCFMVFGIQRANAESGNTYDVLASR